MDRILEWIAENPIYAGIMIACAVIIIVLVILLIAHSVRRSKRKKEKEAQAEAAAEANDLPASAETDGSSAPATEKSDVCAEEEPAEEEPAEAAYCAPAPLPAAADEDGEEPAPSEADTTAEVNAAEEETSAEEAPAAAADGTAVETENAAEPAPEETAPAGKKEKNAPAAKKTAKAAAKKPAKAEAEKERRTAYTGKWLIFKREDKSCYFELRASNGEKLLRSLDYTSLSGAKSAINTYKNNIAKDNITIEQSKAGQYYFRLLSGSKQLLCTGETYSSRPACESAVESVKRFAETAVVAVAADEQAD